MPDMLPRIGIIGCGAIGSYVAAAIDSKKIPCEVSAVFDILPEAAAELSTSLSSKPPVLPMEELIGKSDIVLEAAGGGAVDSVVRSCVAAGKVLLLVSTGGLKHEHIDLFKCAENGAELHVVSGAIAGVDGILAFAKGDIESITHITRKPPKGLAGAPYLEKNAINTKDIS
ncbi:MAG TPA: aspartate dehydrogenase, partial [bacterium]|nr:aspartate dehydrogenase [bacterium]